MSLSIPVWFCVVKSEVVSPNGSYAYRIIQSIKCEWDDLDRLYGEYQSYCYGNIGCTTMVFTREPDETPVKAMSLYPLELGKMIGNMSKNIDLLKSLLETERKWKDQLAEDNRIMRSKLGIPDSHFKYDEKMRIVPDGVIAIDIVETTETRERSSEYNDW